MVTYVGEQVEKDASVSLLVQMSMILLLHHGDKSNCRWCAGGGAAAWDLWAGQEAAIRSFSPIKRTRLDRQTEPVGLKQTIKPNFHFDCICCLCLLLVVVVVWVQVPLPEESASPGVWALRQRQLSSLQSQRSGLGPAATLDQPLAGPQEPEHGSVWWVWTGIWTGPGLLWALFQQAGLVKTRLSEVTEVSYYGNIPVNLTWALYYEQDLGSSR